MKKIMLALMLLISSLKANFFSDVKNVFEGQGKEQAGCLKEWIINDTENVLTGLKNCSYTNNLIGDALQSSDPINYLKNNAEHVGIKLADNYGGWTQDVNTDCNNLINSYINWSKDNSTGDCKHTLQGSGKFGADITTGIQWTTHHVIQPVVHIAHTVAHVASNVGHAIAHGASNAWHSVSHWFSSW